MRLKLSAFFLILVVSASATPAADSGRAALPKTVSAAVSLASPNAFIDTLDQYLANALADTPQNYQAGLLPALAMMFMPPPLQAADLDKEAHIVFLADASPFSRAVFVVACGDYQEFLKHASEDGEASAITDAVTEVKTAGGLRFFLADGGNGTAVVANSEQDARDAPTVLAAWRPAADPNAALTVDLADFETLDISGDVKRILEKSADNGGEAGNYLAERANAGGLDGEMVKGLFRLVGKSYAALGRELRTLDETRIELKLDAHDLAVSIALRGKDGFLLSRIVDKSSSLKNETYPLAKAVDKSAGAFSQIAPPQSVLPENADLIRQIAAVCADEIMPSLKDEAMRAIDAFFAAGPGESVYAIRDDGSYVEYYAMRDPAAAAEAIADLYQIRGKAIAALLKESADAKPLVERKDEKVGDLAVHRFRIAIADHPKITALLKESGEQEKIFIKALENVDATIAVTGGAVVFVPVNIDSERMAKIAADVAGSPAPFVETPEAKGLFDRLRSRQIAVSLVTVDAITKTLLTGILADETIPPEGREVLENAMADMKASREMIAFSQGTRAGGYVMECVLPAKTLNDALKNYFLVVEREAALYPDDEDNGGAEDDGQYDDSDMQEDDQQE